MKEVLMFTIFHAKITRYPLMPVQKNILFKWISHYESHGGPWLGKFPWRECRFYWSDAMAQSDVLGAASSFSGDVYLQNEATDSWAASGKWDPEIWGALIAPSAVHELRHLYQRRKLGLLIYAVLALPVLVTFKAATLLTSHRLKTLPRGKLSSSGHWSASRGFLFLRERQEASHSLEYSSL